MISPTRIAMVSEHASPLALLGSADAGGQNVYVDEIGRALAALGFAVDIFTRRDSPDLPQVVEWAPGVRVIHISAGPAAPIAKDAIWAVMREFLHGMLDFMLRSGVRYDLLHGHFWMSGWAVIRLRRRLGLPAVQLFHATGATKRRHQGGADTSPEERIPVEREIVRRVERVIAQCPAEYAELVNDYRADPGKLCIVPGAVNIQRFRPLSRAEARRAIGLADDGSPLAVYVGRVLPRKDVRNALHALARLVHGQGSPARLLVVGGEAGPDAGEEAVLRELAGELGLSERVIFAGKRQPDELRNYYCAADVAVSTPWYEPFGLTALEAMACGRPIVVSAVGGLTFTVHDGVTGRHVPPRDPDALAAALGELLAHPERCAAMGWAARARVEREFTWARTARRTAALYTALLDERGRPSDPATRARAVGEPLS